MLPDRRSTMVLRRLYPTSRPDITLAKSETLLSAHRPKMPESQRSYDPEYGRGIREVPQI